MSDPAVIGALIGLAIGLVDFVILGYLKSRLAEQAPRKRMGSGFAIEVARFSQLLLFPMVGWFAGPVLLA